MSETDSFIEEVTEEVRRDRLFGLMRRYGWIAVLAVLLIVGGAAYREYSRAAEQAAARALGDALLAALDNEDVDAGEREKLINVMATQSGAAALLKEDSLSASDLKGMGGKNGMTQKYLKSAEDAATANLAFVRAVYGESKPNGKIQSAVKAAGR